MPARRDCPARKTRYGAWNIEELHAEASGGRSEKLTFPREAGLRDRSNYAENNHQRLTSAYYEPEEEARYRVEQRR